MVQSTYQKLLNSKVQELLSNSLGRFLAAFNPPVKVSLPPHTHTKFSGNPSPNSGETAPEVSKITHCAPWGGPHSIDVRDWQNWINAVLQLCIKYLIMIFLLTHLIIWLYEMR